MSLFGPWLQKVAPIMVGRHGDWSGSDRGRDNSGSS